MGMWMPAEPEGGSYSYRLLGPPERSELNSGLWQEQEVLLTTKLTPAQHLVLCITSVIFISIYIRKYLPENLCYKQNGGNDYE